MRPPLLYRQSDAAAASPHAGAPLPAKCVEPVPAALGDRADGNGPLALATYGLLGAVLGVVFTQAQVVSWFRIYEMFRFESFHMSA